MGQSAIIALKSIVKIAIFSLILASCANQTDTTKLSNSQVKSGSNDQVMQLVNQYYLVSMENNPVSATFNGYSQFNDRFNSPIGQAWLDNYYQNEQHYLQKLKQIDSQQLSGQGLLNYQVFDYDRQVNLQSQAFPDYLLPINQMSGFHNIFAGLGSGKSAQPFKTAEDYDNFIKRAKGFVLWMDSAIKAMEQGIEQGITLPKVIVKKLLPQLRSQIKSDASKSIFWQPIINMPSDIEYLDQLRIRADYRELFNQQVMPVYKRMADFIEYQYLPNARESIAYGDLPNGQNWYQYKIKVATSLDLNAEQIHQIGLNEVSRILKQMTEVKQTVDFKGDLAAFFEHLKTDEQFYFKSEKELIDGYKDIKHKIEKRVPKLFNIKPKADYIVRAVEKYRAVSAAGASYQSPAPDGSRPGIFYINSYNLKAQPKFLMETLSIHEAAPGHHFQLALQQEIEGLPDYRKFGIYTAYAEGWALYAESLGKEMGLFTDPYMWYGRLVDEQLRAMRLVVDTGMHALGWNREQAIDYMKANSSMAESDIVAEVERYIAWPGQALSYKLGQIKIRELRNYAEAQLGDKFDVKEFHTQILIDGALPLAILEDKIKRWVESVK